MFETSWFEDSKQRALLQASTAEHGGVIVALNLGAMAE